MMIAGLLHRLGAQVHAVEPYNCVDLPDGIVRAELTAAEVAAADVVVVLSDHDCFDYELVEREARYVFDTRDRCRGTNVEAL